jgi:hypothetical protein
MKPESGGATASGLLSQLCRAYHQAASGNMGRDPDAAAGQPSHRASDHNAACEMCGMAGRAAPAGKPARRGAGRLPWRALGVCSPAVGGIAAAYDPHPLAGLVIVIGGVAVAVTVIATAVTVMATALFGSATTSDRAFRLLRWSANRPEPEMPPAAVTEAGRGSGRRHQRRHRPHARPVQAGRDDLDPLP